MRRHLGLTARFPVSTALPRSARTMRIAFAERVAGQVQSVEISNGGNGWAASFPFTVSGVSGRAASGVAYSRAGVLAMLRVDDPGDNLVAPLTVNLTAGGGSGAVVSCSTIDPIAEARAAGITHIVWNYAHQSSAAADAAWTAAIAAAGLVLQRTLSGLVPYQTPDAACTSFDGVPVPCGWQVNEGKAMGDPARPGFETYQLALLQTELSKGSTAIQFDDPSPSVTAARSVVGARTGGPFGVAALAAFNPGYVAQLQAAGVTQDPWDWTSRTYTSATGNWEARYLAGGGQFPSRDAWVAHVKASVIAFHRKIAAMVPGLYSGNVYDPLPKGNSSVWMLPAFKAALFETDPDNYSGSTPPDVGQRYTRLVVNCRSCEAAAEPCIPHLQPLLNAQTGYAHTRAERVALLRQQIPLVYAHGGLPTYPWDTYEKPWSQSPLTQNARFFAKLTDGFVPQYQFVAQWAHLFDAAESFNALLLMCDSSTDEGRAESTMMAWADTCLRNGIPFCFYMLGPGFERMPALEAAARRVVNCSVESPITNAVTGPNVVTIGAFPTSQWAQLRAVQLAGTFTDCFAVVRLARRSVVVHILNFDGVVRSGLTLTVLWSAMPELRRGNAMQLAPGANPVPLLSATGDASGLNLRLAPVGDWAMVVIEA